MVLAAALALVLSAPTDKLPYPAPRAATVTDKLRCDYATVLVVRWEKGEFQGTTPAGVVTYKAGIEAQVFDQLGRPVGAVSKLTPGDKVRVYYLVEDGPRAIEVDLEK